MTIKLSPTTAVRKMYDESADSYAQMMDTEIDLPIYASTLDRLAERIAGLPGPLIDTSCGSGHMLALYHDRYDAQRPLVGVDLSPGMVSITAAKLASCAEIFAGDMRVLDSVGTGTAAAVLSFFAIHHLGPEAVRAALLEWQRVLCPGGQLLVAAWEGTGPIDYGQESEIVAQRYTQEELVSWALSAGFVVDRCTSEPVEEMDMDGIYLEASRV
jgi:ubiquinone/menaquinone biosynthesis C-methylase UbiE